jgi:hypothetical protein
VPLFVAESPDFVRVGLKLVGNSEPIVRCKILSRQIDGVLIAYFGLGSLTAHK